MTFPPPFRLPESLRQKLLAAVPPPAESELLEGPSEAQVRLAGPIIEAWLHPPGSEQVAMPGVDAFLQPKESSSPLGRVSLAGGGQDPDLVRAALQRAWDTVHFEEVERYAQPHEVWIDRLRGRLEQLEAGPQREGCLRALEPLAGGMSSESSEALREAERALAFALLALHRSSPLPEGVLLDVFCDLAERHLTELTPVEREAVVHHLETRGGKVDFIRVGPHWGRPEFIASDQPNAANLCRALSDARFWLDHRARPAREKFLEMLQGLGDQTLSSSTFRQMEGFEPELAKELAGGFDLAAEQLGHGEAFARNALSFAAFLRDSAGEMVGPPQNWMADQLEEIRRLSALSSQGKLPEAHELRGAARTELEPLAKALWEVQPLLDQVNGREGASFELHLRGAFWPGDWQRPTLVTVYVKDQEAFTPLLLLERDEDGWKWPPDLREALGRALEQNYLEERDWFRNTSQSEVKILRSHRTLNLLEPPTEKRDL